MGNRFNSQRYDRPGGRCAFVWPTRNATKTALRRLGDSVRHVANDIYASRRDNNRVRRAADRAAVRAAVAEAREDAPNDRRKDENTRWRVREEATRTRNG